MTVDEFLDYAEAKPRLLWQAGKMIDTETGPIFEPTEDFKEGTGIAFRVEGLPYFDDHPERFDFVANAGMAKMTPKELWKKLTYGRDVEHITRITGYLTKVSSWNKGKLGELKDRARQNIGGL